MTDMNRDYFDNLRAKQLAQELIDSDAEPYASGVEAARKIKFYQTALKLARLILKESQ